MYSLSSYSFKSLLNVRNSSSLFLVRVLTSIPSGNFLLNQNTNLSRISNLHPLNMIFVCSLDSFPFTTNGLFTLRSASLLSDAFSVDSRIPRINNLTSSLPPGQRNTPIFFVNSRKSFSLNYASPALTPPNGSISRLIGDLQEWALFYFNLPTTLLP